MAARRHDSLAMHILFHLMIHGLVDFHEVVLVLSHRHLDRHALLQQVQVLARDRVRDCRMVHDHLGQVLPQLVGKQVRAEPGRGQAALATIATTTAAAKGQEPAAAALLPRGEPAWRVAPRFEAAQGCSAVCAQGRPDALGELACRLGGPGLLPVVHVAVLGRAQGKGQQGHLELRRREILARVGLGVAPELGDRPPRLLEAGCQLPVPG